MSFFVGAAKRGHKNQIYIKENKGMVLWRDGSKANKLVRVKRKLLR